MAHLVVHCADALLSAETIFWPDSKLFAETWVLRNTSRLHGSAFLRQAGSSGRGESTWIAPPKPWRPAPTTSP